MSYKVIPTEHFKQQVRLLQKDYLHIRQDLQALHRMLLENPKCGDCLGKKVYKIRLKNSDIGKGKRSGYRVISYVLDEQQIVRLLTIYAKSRKVDIRDDEITNRHHVIWFHARRGGWTGVRGANVGLSAG